MTVRMAEAIRLAVTILLILSPVYFFHQVRAASLDPTIVSIQPGVTCCDNSGSPLPINKSFSVAVVLNLASGESINGFDIRINYTNPHTNGQPGTLRATGFAYSSNIFANYSPQVSANCVDGIGSCQTDDSVFPGQVHFAQAIIGAPSLTGPLSGLLFYINFNVTGLGSSILYFDRTNLINPQDPSNPSAINPHFIRTISLNGGFGNKGVVAFFNYQTTNPSVSPSLLPQISVSFDASQSVSAYNQSYAITGYHWDYGDGTVQSSPGAFSQHTYQSAGTYHVNLTATDSQGKSGSLVWPIVVLPMLGSLQIFLVDSVGTVIRGGVTVLAFNSSSPNPFLNKTVDQAGEADLDKLVPGNYLLKFQGVGFQPGSKQESVIPGFTQRDIVSLNRVPSAPNYTEDIFLGAFAAAISAFAVFVVLKKRRLKKQPVNLAKKNRKI